MAVDMLRAQDAEKTAGPAGAKTGAPGLGMVSASVHPAALTGIDALDHSAEQEALHRAGGGVGDKRKLVRSFEEEDEEGPARKELRDADEIDI